MLDGLCGNRTVPKILLFLFVNGRSYGTELKGALGTALTPIQKALQRLERAGIIMSYYEGKTRLYQFNPACPQLSELEMLLRSSYNQLTLVQKQRYYLAKEGRAKELSAEKKREVVLKVWKRLASVSRLTVHVKTKEQRPLENTRGYSNKGVGEVAVKREGEGVLIFSEKGQWHRSLSDPVGFTNLFRWTLDRMSSSITLEHLRHGIEDPVALLQLTPSSPHSLSSNDSQLCAEDIYFGQLFFDEERLCLNWRVIGPKKNEEIHYYYS